MKILKYNDNTYVIIHVYAINLLGRKELYHVLTNNKKRVLREIEIIMKKYVPDSINKLEWEVRHKNSRNLNKSYHTIRLVKDDIYETNPNMPEEIDKTCYYEYKYVEIKPQNYEHRLPTISN